MALAKALLSLVAIALVLLPQAQGRTGGGRQLTVQARDVCRTVAALRLVVTDGTCEGSATADCAVVLERMDLIGKEFKDWWGVGVCDEGRADAAAEKISDVLANLWLETAVQVKCVGVGFACGWSAVEVPGWFKSVGDALDLVAAEAGARDVKFCAPDMRSFTKDEDVDIESTRQEVCATGGLEDNLKIAVKSVLTKAMKSVFIRATSGACNRYAESSCPGGAAPPKKAVSGGEEESTSSTPETADEEPPIETSRTSVVIEEQSPEETSATGDAPQEQQTEVPPESGDATGDAPQEQQTEVAPESGDEAGEQQPEEDPAPSEVASGSTEYKETAGSPPDEPEPINATQEDALSAVDTVDILGDPDLDGLIIGPADPIDNVVIGKQASSGDSDTSEVSEETCKCPTELCNEKSTCRAVPLAQCKTVPKDGKCDECEAKFFVEGDQVGCSLDICKPARSICASNSLAKCCGVCCRCDTFAQRFKAFGTLELGFCQNGSICNCLGASGYRGG